MDNRTPSNSVPDSSGPDDPSFERRAASILDGSIIERFATIARDCAGRLAIQDAAVALTYAELSQRVDCIAAATGAATDGRAGPVALLLPAAADFPAAMLGVLAAGRAYVALDCEVAAERNGLIVAESGACAVLSTADLVAATSTWLPDGLPVIDIADLPARAPSGPSMRAGPESVAGIYYTSGSTGRPKGIAIHHRSLLHHALQNARAARVSSSDRVLLLVSPSFGTGGVAVLYALLSGAALHMVRTQNSSPAHLVREIRDRRITVFSTVPTTVRRIAECVGPGDRLDEVRVVGLGGDRIEWSDVDACRRCFSRNVQVYALLGSTECGTYLHWFVDDGPRASAAQPPVGRPAPGRTVTIVGEDGAPLPDGETGEIIVASRYNALGIWRGSDLQVQPFPGDPTDSKARVFATGDLGRRRSDGLVEFVGRKDQQIKLHGYRIEPAEVESALAVLPVVGEAAVAVRRNPAGTPLALVAYVVLRPGMRGLLPRHVQAMLAQRLPRHAIPAQITFVRELPRLFNFKIDRRALAQLDAEQTSDTRIASENPLLAQIVRIFQKVIAVEGATPDDNVASLGGDSLQELILAEELERYYAPAISEQFMAQRPTIRQVADWIVSSAAE